MAPKKKQPQQQNKNPSSSKPKTASSGPNSARPQTTSSGPKLQISAENENENRLLINSGCSAAVPVDDSLTKAQKAKNLRAVYEQLSCEGFTNDQIELALSAVKEGATYEAALDWLCLNVPGNELPLKFSSGVLMAANEGGSVGVVLTSRDDWTPSVDTSAKIDEETPGIAIRTKGNWDDKTLDLCQPSQADWIKRYVEQQEEEELSTWEDDADDEGGKVSKPRSYDVIAKEYHAARLEAAEAKQKKDKKGQERAGKMIRDLKQELAALGLSDDILAAEFEQEQSIECAYSAFEDTDSSSKPDEQSEGLLADELKADQNDMEQYSSVELPVDSTPSELPVQEKSVAEEETTDMQIGNFFMEDVPSDKFLTPTILELQRKERLREIGEIRWCLEEGRPSKDSQGYLSAIMSKIRMGCPKV